MKFLIENGMGVDEGVSFASTLRDGDKRAIHYAAESGKTEMVKYLLSKDADPTRTSGLVSKLLSSSTPYRLAKKNGYEETARVLQQAMEEWKRKR
jgi:ankyrin repeat protein